MSTHSHPAEMYVSMSLSVEVLYLYTAKCAPKEHSMILGCVYSKCIKEAGITIFPNPFLRGNFGYSDDREKKEVRCSKLFCGSFSLLIHNSWVKK